jgi:ribonuclease BN (tRNA processing enzyme)
LKITLDKLHQIADINSVMNEEQNITGAGVMTKDQRTLQDLMEEKKGQIQNHRSQLEDGNDIDVTEYHLLMVEVATLEFAVKALTI